MRDFRQVDVFTGLPYQGNPERNGGEVAARIGSGKATAPYVASQGTRSAVRAVSQCLTSSSARVCWMPGVPL